MKILNWEYCLYLTSLAGKEKQAFSKGEEFQITRKFKMEMLLEKNLDH